MLTCKINIFIGILNVYFFITEHYLNRSKAVITAFLEIRKFNIFLVEPVRSEIEVDSKTGRFTWPAFAWIWQAHFFVLMHLFNLFYFFKLKVFLKMKNKKVGLGFSPGAFRSN